MQRLLARLIRARSGGRVVGGPFRGLLLPASRSGLALRYLLGTHELELHPAIERFVGAGPATVINVGAAQGYYAVGVARRCPTARVVAFEAVEQLRQAIALAALANGVGERIAILGRCDAAALRECAAPAGTPLLVLADVEGGEAEVFDAATVPHLAHAGVVIETHDHLVPGITAQLRERFAATHLVEVHAPRERTPADLPRAMASWPWRLLTRFLVWLVKEYRPSQQAWLVFTPRSDG